MAKKRFDVMVDLETLGTTANSIIMSLGAVRFDLYGTEIDDQGFYASISIESNLEAGRKLSEDTLLWWLKQESDARQVFFEPKLALREALEQFSDWIGFDPATQIWSNGADFDIPMLAHAFTHQHMAAPWSPYRARCYRTMKNVHGMIDQSVKTPAMERAGTHHNALDDAVDQARHLQLIFRTLRDPSTNTTPSLARRMAA